MQRDRDNRVGHHSITLILASALMVLAACTIQKSRDNSGEKKVDIKVPFASIHVGQDSGAKDVGLATYPGARVKSDTDGDKNNASVNIGGEDFGVKVIAATYLSDDPPQKVIDFYRKELKRYGNVVECPKGLSESHDGDKGEIKCDESGSAEPGKLEMAVGVPNHQHVVSVKPSGNGTEFSLVYVQVRGKDHETM